MNQYHYSFWPGSYSFKNEINLFIIYLKDWFDDLVKKISTTEQTTAV